ncbi:MAG: HNH endonuclease [Deltaproteobacteria bacterium]
MFLEDLKKIKDSELLTRFSQIVQKEREATATVVFYLSEIARRKLYLEEAYSSLFSYVTQKFHYSEGAAYRRIQAAKVSQIYPEILGLLSNGKVSLITLSLIEPHLTKENAQGWVQKIIGKSKREVEFMLSELSLRKENHRDVIRRLPIFRAEIKEQMGLEKPTPEMSVERQEPAPLKAPGSFSCLSEMASESKTAQKYTATGGNGGETRKIKIEFVAKEEMAKKIERARYQPDKSQPDKSQPDKSQIEEQRKPMTRYIPQKVRRIVFKRDQGECSYESANGKRCGERNFIQMDHLRPFALGGESTEENLRILCAKHNQWRAERTFGKSG